MRRDGIRDLMAGTWAAQAVYVAARLGVADHLAGTPKNSTELAQLCGADSGALYRLLRALSAVGLFREHDGSSFSLAPAGRLLVSDTPGSLRALAIWNGEVSHRMWAHALDVVKDGAPAPRRVVGSDEWGYLSRNPDLQVTFDAAMAGLARQTAAEVLDTVDFHGVERIVDVGGGDGTLLAAILSAHPHVSGVLVDRAEVVAAARPRLAHFGDRLEALAGDLIGELPPAGDLYVLSSVLHDWNDPDAIRILQSCRRAMKHSSRLLVIECVLCSGETPILPLLLDLHMLVMTGGRERTENEYRELLSGADLHIDSVTALTSAESVVAARPATFGSH